jgi:hypothetical protein
MKTNLVLVISAITLTMFAFNGFAADTLLSPRAKDNQIKVVSGSIKTQDGRVTYITSASSVLLSPRAKANQTKVVNGGPQSDGVRAVKCRAIGSPKYQADMGKQARTACCGMTLAGCPDSNQCGK